MSTSPPGIPSSIVNSEVATLRGVAWRGDPPAPPPLRGREFRMECTECTNCRNPRNARNAKTHGCADCMKLQNAQNARNARVAKCTECMQCAACKNLRNARNARIAKNSRNGCKKSRNARNVRDCGKRGIAGSAELRELLRSPKTLKGALKKLSKSSQRALRKLWKGSQKLSKKLPTMLSKEHFEIFDACVELFGSFRALPSSFLELLDACVQLFGSKKLAKNYGMRAICGIAGIAALSKSSPTALKRLWEALKKAPKRLSKEHFELFDACVEL